MKSLRRSAAACGFPVRLSRLPALVALLSACAATAPMEDGEKVAATSPIEPALIETDELISPGRILSIAPQTERPQ